MFQSWDIDLRPWATPKPIVNEHPLVYDRLFQDFNRRQEAKKRLISIIDLKEKAERRKSLESGVNGKKNFNRSLSKPEVRNMVQRFNDYLQRKLLKIEKKRHELAENQEKMLKEMMESKKNYKTDPEAFKRLTQPKVAKAAQEQVKSVKTFSIKEAIESGKRLMGAKVTDGFAQVNLTPSPVRVKRFDRSEEKKRLSPRKEIRIEGGRKNIEEIFKRCKNKAMLMSFLGKSVKSQEDVGISLGKTIDSFRSSYSERLSN